MDYKPRISFSNLKFLLSAFEHGFQALIRVGSYRFLNWVMLLSVKKHISRMFPGGKQIGLGVLARFYQEKAKKKITWVIFIDIQIIESL